MRNLFLTGAALAFLVAIIGTDCAAAAPSGTLTLVVPNFNRENFDRGVTATIDLPYNGQQYDALIGADRNGDLGPERGLAESWTMSPDARSITLRLRKNVKFHDGQPFTADDVIFSLERY